MKKKLMVFVVTVALLSLVIPNAFATITDKEKKELGDLYNQVFELRKQVVLKYVEAGELSQDEGSALIKRLEKDLENARKQGFKPVQSGVGGGCGGGYNTSLQSTGYNMQGYGGQLL